MCTMYIKTNTGVYTESDNELCDDDERLENESKKKSTRIFFMLLSVNF